MAPPNTRSNLIHGYVAFWLAVFEVAQVLGCARQKKANLAKLWWKMAETAVLAAVVISLRVFLFRGAGKAN